MRCFGVYDSALEAYLTPFFAATSGVALRMFMQAVNESGHDFNRFAEHYSLFELGDFDVANGKLSGGKAPLFIASAHTVRETPEEAERATARSDALIRDLEVASDGNS